MQLTATCERVKPADLCADLRKQLVVSYVHEHLPMAEKKLQKYHETCEECRKEEGELMAQHLQVTSQLNDPTR